MRPVRVVAYRRVLEGKGICVLPVVVVPLAAHNYALGCTGTSRSSCHAFWLNALLNTCSIPEDYPSTEELREILQVPPSF